MNSRVVTTFGKYKITGLLGKGGMGDVYQAYDTLKGRTVALKILADQFSQDERFRTRFLRELHAAAILQEPQVIPIHDRGEIDGGHSAVGQPLVQRTISVPGTVSCPSTGSTDGAGNNFRMQCEPDGSGTWIRCTGGDDAVVYIY